MKRYRSALLIDREAAVHIFRDRATAIGDEPHDHDFWELVYVEQGGGVQQVDSGEYAVRRGDLLLLHEGQIHSFCGTPEFSYINLCFDPRLLLRASDAKSAAAELFGYISFLDSLMRGGCLLHLSGREREEVEGVLAAMLKEYAERRYDWQTVMRRYLDIFLLSVLRALKEQEAAPAESDPWERLAAYIDDNLTGDLSLTALAERLFYNPSYLSRAFSARFGCGLSAYVAGRRAARAADLAKEGGYTVERLAEESGFASKSALYRAFRRHRGEELGAFLARCKKTN